jgi:predicted ATPase
MLIAAPPFKAQHADSAARCGDAASALTLLDEALDQIDRPGWQERFALSNILRIRACALQQAGQACEAEAMFQKALDVARGQHAKSWELRAATSYARLLKVEGRAKEAISLLHPIYHWFTEGHDTHDLRVASALLEELAQVPTDPTSVSARAGGS